MPSVLYIEYQGRCIARFEGNKEIDHAMILKECTAAGRGWNEDLALLDERERDIYFTEEYVKLYENNEDRAACFVYK